MTNPPWADLQPGDTIQSPNGEPWNADAKTTDDSLEVSAVSGGYKNTLSKDQYKAPGIGPGGADTAAAGPPGPIPVDQLTDGTTSGHRMPGGIIMWDFPAPDGREWTVMWAAPVTRTSRTGLPPRKGSVRLFSDYGGRPGPDLAVEICADQDAALRALARWIAQAKAGEFE
ncbi:hypothetical protein ACGFJT_37415 [Actinomadura geliboluensis]|uniref:hypothetical protein n=1 Tax=Actinomadura geliboluensis TaxID=882440 RepID=UPI00371D69E3